MCMILMEFRLGKYYGDVFEVRIRWCDHICGREKISIKKYYGRKFGILNI